MKSTEKYFECSTSMLRNETFLLCVLQYANNNRSRKVFEPQS